MFFTIFIYILLNINIDLQNEINDIDQLDFTKWISNSTRKRVAIIGGGVSGLSALKSLHDEGFFDIVLFEAQERLGGRVNTIRNGSIILEEGAQWIHGGTRNPLYTIAEDLNALELYKEDDNLVIINEDGSSASDEDYKMNEQVFKLLFNTFENDDLVDYYGQGYGQYFIDKASKEISIEEESKWLHLMEQVVNSMEGTNSWKDKAARDADDYVDYGENYLWKNGFDTLINYLVKDIQPSQIHLKTPINKIVWELDDKPGALVITESGDSYLVDHVLVTTSVAYLKKQHETLFYPPIPETMLNALKGVELGTSNKIIIGWKNSWWGNKPVKIQILWTEFNLPKEMEWLYGIVYLMPSDRKNPILLAFVTGTYSLNMEQLSEDEVKNHLMFLLNRLFPEKHIPDPEIFMRSTWNSNPWIYGSYSSYITVEGDKSGLHSREPLRQPFINKWKQSIVHFAGEHTYAARHGTTDGAFVSGKREAKKILKQTLDNL